MAERATVYLSLGSNLGDRERNLREGLRLLAGTLEIARVSSVYETEPWGYTEQPKFLNCVCEAETELMPRDLLVAVKEVEGEAGRHLTFRYGPRVLDIDILLYGGSREATSELTIPHPGLAERAFVLVPLAELAPELVHPGLHRTVAELLRRVRGVDGVRRWGPPLEVPSTRPTAAG